MLDNADDYPPEIADFFSLLRGSACYGHSATTREKPKKNGCPGSSLVQQFDNNSDSMEEPFCAKWKEMGDH